MGIPAWIRYIFWTPPYLEIRNLPYIQLSDRRVNLGPGDNPIAGTDVIVNMDGHGAASIRGDGVRVNGVSIGGQPSLLIHGDKIEVGDSAPMVFASDTTSGSTQYMSRANIADLLKASGVDEHGSGGDAKPASVTGGRLVSQVDGREYHVHGGGNGGFSIGRDPGCDIVIASGQVSRNHAEIELGSEGYYIIDTSTNGVYVNGRRVEGTQTLKRGDVIKVGDEEFRFYADEAASAPATPKAAAPPVAQPVSQQEAATATAPQHKPGTPSTDQIPAPRDATREPVKKAEEKKSSGLAWWVWLLVAIVIVAGVYFIIQGQGR